MLDVSKYGFDYRYPAPDGFVSFDSPGLPAVNVLCEDYGLSIRIFGGGFEDYRLDDEHDNLVGTVAGDGNKVKLLESWLFGVTDTPMRRLLEEAVEAWPQYDIDDDYEHPVNGGDLAEWFGEWRERAKEAIT